MDSNVWITAAVTLLGAGGLVSLIKAIIDYRAGHAQREDDADERLVTRLEKSVEKLTDQLDAANEYISELTDALIDAGLKVPRRKRR